MFYCTGKVFFYLPFTSAIPKHTVALYNKHTHTSSVSLPAVMFQEKRMLDKADLGYFPTLKLEITSG